MEIVKKVTVPTGEIYVGKGEKGLIEFFQFGNPINDFLKDLYDLINKYKDKDEEL